MKVRLIPLSGFAVLGLWLLAGVAPARATPDGGPLYLRLRAAGGVGAPLSLPDFPATVDDVHLHKTIRLGRPERIVPRLGRESTYRVAQMGGTAPASGQAHDP